MNFIKKNWQKIIFLASAFIVPVISFAQQSTPNSDVGQPTPSSASPTRLDNPIPKVTSIPGLVHTLLVGVLTIGVPVVALAIIYCGFLFVSARGNPEKLKKAKDAFFYTLIGAAILLGSWAIATLISNTVTGLGS